MIIPDENIEFKDWAESLRIDVSTQDVIPYVENEENWRDWGDIVASSPTFVKAGCPRTDNFSNWRDWGKMLYSRFG